MTREPLLTGLLAPVRAVDILIRPADEHHFEFLRLDGTIIARVNTAAAFIWQQCDGAHSLDDITATIADATERDPGEAFEDVSHAAKLLFYSELILLGPGASRPLLTVSGHGFVAGREAAVVKALSAWFNIVLADASFPADVLVTSNSTRARSVGSQVVVFTGRVELALKNDFVLRDEDFSPAPGDGENPDSERLRPVAAERLRSLLLGDVEAPPERKPDTRRPPRLTVGMATYDDYDGVYFTIQAIRMFHPEVLDDIVFLVIDNNPEGPCAKSLESLASWIPSYRYIPRGDITGTAIRDRVFREADTEYVMCIDSHVFIVPGALRRLLEYLEAHPQTTDLLQGPLIFDDLENLATHFEPLWRSGMFGVWARDPRGVDPLAPAFEIPMQGLGLAVCRRDAWQGYNPCFRGFGGEEGYIHQKFRNAGSRTLCLPFLRWLHRFGRPMGTQYPNRWEDRIRNYLIGFAEVGLPDAGIIEHFGKLIGTEQVKSVVEALKAESTSLPRGDDSVPTVENQTVVDTSADPARSDRRARWCPDEIRRRFEDKLATPSDINEHLPLLRSYATRVDTIIEMGVREVVSTWALLAGCPMSMTSIDIVGNDRIGEVVDIARRGGIDYSFIQGDTLQIDIPECDLLFIDTLHTYAQLLGELKRHSVRVGHYIMLHDTVSYGECDESLYNHASDLARQYRGERQGLIPALCDFFSSAADGANWSIIQRFANNNGLTVLQRRSP